jgi:hypothetical protein
MPVATISSAASVSEVRDVIAGKPPAIEATLASYAKEQRSKTWADLFITNALFVHRDANQQQVAEIMGDARMIPAEGDHARVPVVAMVFGLPVGETDVGFDVEDSQGKELASEKRTVTVQERQRVAFVSAELEFAPEAAGTYHVHVHRAKDDAEIGHAHVAIVTDSDDDEVVDSEDEDSSTDGNPDVDVVVAEAGLEDPLRLMGIRSSWAERSYPRRVGFTWFTRGSRGWAGSDVVVTAYVLDDAGKIVGRADGCYMPELRPERPWSCIGQSMDSAPPLAMKEGAYDIVFAVNDRPVAYWPMEATIRDDPEPGGGLERWMEQVRRGIVHAQKNGAAPATDKGAKPEKKPAGPDKKPAKPAPPKPAPPSAKR